MTTGLALFDLQLSNEIIFMLEKVNWKQILQSAVILKKMKSFVFDMIF